MNMNLLTNFYMKQPLFLKIVLVTVAAAIIFGAGYIVGSFFGRHFG